MKCFSLLPINYITNTQYIVPVGIAGIQKPGMASFNLILVTWIPAVHAGMKSYFMGMNNLIGGKVGLP